MFWPASAANATASIRALSKVAPVLQWNQLIDPAAEDFIEIGYAGVSDLGIGDQAGKDTLAKIDELTAAGYKFHGPDGLPNVLEISLGSGDFGIGGAVSVILVLLLVAVSIFYVRQTVKEDAL